MSESHGMSDEIEESLRREPFTPFVFVMNSGDRYLVRYPGLVSVGKSLVTVARAHSQRYDVLRLTEISSLEVLEPE